MSDKWDEKAKEIVGGWFKKYGAGDLEELEMNISAALRAASTPPKDHVVTDDGCVRKYEVLKKYGDGAFEAHIWSEETTKFAADEAAALAAKGASDGK